MPPALVIAGLIVKYGPVLAEEVATLIHRTAEPTLDEWKVVFAKLKTYDDYVTGPAAPAVQPTAGQ